MPTVFEDGPYLNAAVLCERAIQETDGVISLVRVVDKVTAGPIPGSEPTPAQMPPFLVSLSLVVLLRAGSARGNYTLTVRPQDPTGTQLPGNDVPVSFPGTDEAQGATAITNMNLGIQHEGLYWFDVLLDGQLLTRVPLRTEYRLVLDAQPPGPQAPASSE